MTRPSALVVTRFRGFSRSQPAEVGYDEPRW
jgi:hypothetical protein